MALRVGLVEYFCFHRFLITGCEPCSPAFFEQFTFKLGVGQSASHLVYRHFIYIDFIHKISTLFSKCLLLSFILPLFYFLFSKC